MTNNIEKAIIGDNNKVVTVYGKPNCVQCNFTKQYLDNHGIEYREIDVTQDEEAYNELKMNGYQSVPVTAVGTLDNSWSGFRPERLAELKGD